MQELRIHMIEAGAWSGFIASILSPDNIAIAAGACSILLSLSGVLLNITKIINTFKNKKS